MRLWIGNRYRFQAAIDDVTDGQQKFPEYEGDIDEQLLFDFYQQIFIR
jgi:hypothetical protein